MKEKLSILTELIKLAKSDKKLRDEEYNFILAIAAMLKIGKDQLEPLFEKYIEYKAPPREFDRILQFQRLVLMANVDLEVDKTELNTLKIAGLKLGLNLGAIENVLTEMQNHPGGLIPTNKMIEIFKVHLN